MGVTPRPYVVIDGHRIAGQIVNNWESIVLDGLTINHSGRTSPAEQFQLPTATVRIACTAVPDYLVQSPQNRPVEIWIEEGSNRERVFYGMVDTVSMKPTRTSTDVPTGQKFYFLVTLGLVSRPAGLGSVEFARKESNNRPIETLAARMAWLNGLMRAKNPTGIKIDHHSLTPMFSGVSGAGGFWPWRVAAKDYRGQGVVAAWMELALTAAEMTEYLPHDNRLSAVGRRGVPTENFMRLGWTSGYVGLVATAGAIGTVAPARSAPMAETRFNDGGTVRYVQPTFTLERAGTKREETLPSGQKVTVIDRNFEQADFLLSRLINARNLRRASVNTLAYVDYRGITGQDSAEARQANVRDTAEQFALLYEDAGEPPHPPLTYRWDEGWSSFGAARGWLTGETNRLGAIHVAGSVYNMLRPGKPFHRRASMSITYAKRPGSEDRVWTTVLGLTPIKTTVEAPLRIRDINPSATGQSAATMRYDTVPDGVPLTRHAAVRVDQLAAALAANTSTAFTYDQIDPGLTIDEMSLATRGV